MPSPQSAEHPQAKSFQQMQDTAMNVTEGLCSILAMPVEIILRPWYGTRYFSVPVMFCSSALMIVLPVISATATGVAHMIPFVHVASPRGLFDIGSLATLYFPLSFVHSFRLYRRMIHMELEDHSEFEGPPLPFFRFIPKSDSFYFTRIVLEPAFVFITATILDNLFVFQSSLTTYLYFVTLALVMKNFIGWYKGWLFLRKLLDTRAAGPIIARLMDKTATEAQLAPLHLASFPKNISPELRQTAAQHIARVFSVGNDNNNAQGGNNAAH